MLLEVFLSLSSWSVESGHFAYDDARRSSDGIWHYRDAATGGIRCFTDQKSVVPLSENEPSTALSRFGGSDAKYPRSKIS
jgi:hypothetical protein